MATKTIKIFFALSIIFYILLVFYMLFSFFTIRNFEFETASDEASVINSRIDSAYSVDLSFSSKSFQSEISSIFKKNHKIVGILVFSDRHGLEYIKLKDSRYLGETETPDFSTSNAVPDVIPIHPFVKVIRTGLYFANGNSFNSIIIFDLMDRGLFFPVLRNTLIAAIAFLILSVIYLSVYGSSTDSTLPSGKKDTEGDHQPVQDEEIFDTSVGPFGPEEDILSGPLPEMEKDEDTPVIHKSEISSGSSSGMYSDRSGLVWEHFLAEKLDAELKRAASFDQDSCLVFISIKSPSGFIPYRNISELIIEHFTYKDLAFEAGESTFCIIIPEKDIDEGQVEVEKFKKSLLGRFPDSSYKIYAGLTSRNSRLLNEKRMIQEAKAALRRAETEKDSTTIAFRTDLNKYREYIASTI